MSDAKAITPADIERTAGILRLIGHRASMMKGSWENMDIDDRAVDVTEVLLAQISELGWLADLGSELLGGSQARGGADEWLLPEHCRKR